MSKSILVIDTPNSCMGCNFLYCDVEHDTDNCIACEESRKVNLEKEEKPDWCPLREMPEKKRVSLLDNELEIGKKHGYNACIDEILKECGWL